VTAELERLRRWAEAFRFEAAAARYAALLGQEDQLELAKLAVRLRRSLDLPARLCGPTGKLGPIAT
jgi:hypothetical protein